MRQRRCQGGPSQAHTHGPHRQELPQGTELIELELRHVSVHFQSTGLQSFTLSLSVENYNLENDSSLQKALFLDLAQVWEAFSGSV